MQNSTLIEPNGKSAAHEKLVQFKTILAPTDFSEQARFAFRYATCLAERMGGKVIVLHVLQTSSAYYGCAPEIAGTLTQEAQSSLDQMCQTEGVKLDHLETMIRLPVESVSKEIVLAAREVEADLIVVPANHRYGLTHGLFANTVDWIGHHAPCPVLMVPVPSSTP